MEHIQEEIPPVLEEITSQNSFLGNVHNMSEQVQFQYQQLPQFSEITQSNKQQNLEENVNAVEQEGGEEEEMTNIQNFKMRYQETADTIRTEIKQIISIQETKKTTLAIVTQQKDDICQQIIKTKQSIDSLTIENDMLNKKLISCKKEITTLKGNMINKVQIVNELKSLFEDVKTAYEALLRRRSNLSEECSKRESKFQDLLQTSTAVSDLKIMIKEAEDSLKKSNADNIQQQNLPLKNELDEQCDISENLKNEIKKLDQELEDIQLKDKKKLELKQLVEEKTRSLENLQVKLNSVKETQSQLDNLAIQKNQKSIQLQELNVEIENCNTQISQITKENSKLEVELESKKDYLKILEKNVQDIFNNVETMKVNLESCTQQKNQEINELKNKLVNIQDKSSAADAEIVNLKSEFDNLVFEHSKAVDEKNACLINKSSLENEVRISELQKQHLEYIMANLEKKKAKKEMLTKKIDQLKEDNVLRNMTKEVAYLKSSVDYLQAKFTGIKEQESTGRSAVEKAKEEKNDIMIKLRQKRDELHSLILSENVEEIGHNQVTGILKLNNKSSPVSPKRVTFDVSSQDSTSVESSNISVNTGNNDHGNNLDTIVNNLLKTFRKSKTTDTPAKTIKKRRFNMDD